MVKILIVMLLYMMSVCAVAKFNPLDTNDPHYAEFNASLCAYTLDYVKRMDDKMQQLSAKISTEPVEYKKKELLEDFSVASELKKSWSADYMTYCRP